MNTDYLLDYHSLVMEKMKDHCKCCPKAKHCHDECIENECETYHEEESKVISEL